MVRPGRYIPQSEYPVNVEGKNWRGHGGGNRARIGRKPVSQFNLAEMLPEGKQSFGCWDRSSGGSVPKGADQQHETPEESRVGKVPRSVRLGIGP
jgi:hypothetical protein